LEHQPARADSPDRSSHFWQVVERSRRADAARFTTPGADEARAQPAATALYVCAESLPSEPTPSEPTPSEPSPSQSSPAESSPFARDRSHPAIVVAHDACITCGL